MNAPFQGFPPELLAKIAQGAFRPPQAMMGGGMQAPGMQMPQQAPGFNMGNGMAGLGMGLAAWKPGVSAVGPQGSGTGGAYTTADAMSMSGMGGNPSDPNFGVPNGLGITPSSGGGGGGGGFGGWWARNFGGGGS